MPNTFFERNFSAASCGAAEGGNAAVIEARLEGQLQGVGLDKEADEQLMKMVQLTTDNRRRLGPHASKSVHQLCRLLLRFTRRSAASPDHARKMERGSRCTR